MLFQELCFQDLFLPVYFLLIFYNLSFFKYVLWLVYLVANYNLYVPDEFYGQNKEIVNLFFHNRKGFFRENPFLLQSDYKVGSQPGS